MTAAGKATLNPATTFFSPPPPPFPLPSSLVVLAAFWRNNSSKVAWFLEIENFQWHYWLERAAL
jgi:hypothetical protein